MEFGFTEDKQELDRAWNILAAHDANRNEKNPHACMSEHGEVWQHMACFRESGVWFRQFRHRMHPATGQRLVVNVQAINWRAIQQWGE